MTLQLLDLHPDILFKILRDYVPLDVKLRTLWKIPEFRPLLEHRGSYLDSPVPFSLNYLKILRGLRSGCYFEFSNFNYRVFLRIDEATLRISLFHFYLNTRREDYRPNSSCSFYHQSIYCTKKKFKCKNFRNGELTYYLNGFGFFTIYPFFPKMFYCDDLNNRIGMGQRFFLQNSSSPYIFVMLLTSEKKIIGERRNLFDNDGEYQIEELCPITLEVTNDLKYLTWDGGDPIPMAGSEHYWLGDEEHVEGFKICHTDRILKNARKVGDGIKQDKRLKKILWN